MLITYELQLAYVSILNYLSILHFLIFVDSMRIASIRPRASRLRPHKILHLDAPLALNKLTMKDYKPIGCCNVSYKCITKVLANQLKPILPFIISQSQSAFIKRRSICKQYFANARTPNLLVVVMSPINVSLRS